MLTPLDQVLVVCITILLPIHDILFWYPRLLRAAPQGVQRARRQAYLETVVIEWTLVAATVALWAYRGRPWADLGVGLRMGWGFWLALALAALAIVLASWQRLSLVRSQDPEVEAAVLQQIEKVRPLMPQHRADLGPFTLVALTAGICEETLFRGFVIWYLLALTPNVVAWVVGAALFGMAHAYQGSRGVLQTGLVGLGLVILYVLSGSLWIPMVVHAFLDVNSGLLAYAFLRRGRERRLESV